MQATLRVRKVSLALHLGVVGRHRIQDRESLGGTHRRPRHLQTYPLAMEDQAGRQLQYLHFAWMVVYMRQFPSICDRVWAITYFLFGGRDSPMPDSSTVLRGLVRGAG
jgi:hypothetical protein